MAFKPLKKASGKCAYFDTATSTTIAKGDGLEFASGYVQRTTTTARPLLIAMEAVTTTSTSKKILCMVIDPSIAFEADTASTMSQSLVGEKCVMSTYAAVNEADTSSGYIFVERMLSSSKAVVKFQYVS